MHFQDALWRFVAKAVEQSKHWKCLQSIDLTGFFILIMEYGSLRESLMLVAATSSEMHNVLTTQ